MDLKNNLELIIGGIASTVAMAAIIFRFVFFEIDLSTTADFIKDFSEIIVSVLVFFVAVKSILSQSKRKETFKKVFDEELQAWMQRNRPLISKENRFQVENADRYFILSDHDHIFDIGEDFQDDKKYQKGVFVQLPHTFTTNDKIIFFMNKSTFMARAKAKDSDVDTEIDKLIYRTANCISAKFGKELFEASGDPKHNQIHVKIKTRDLDTPEDARTIIKMLDYVMILYLAAA